MANKPETALQFCALLCRLLGEKVTPETLLKNTIFVDYTAIGSEIWSEIETELGDLPHALDPNFISPNSPFWEQSVADFSQKIWDAHQGQPVFDAQGTILNYRTPEDVLKDVAALFAVDPHGRLVYDFDKTSPLAYLNPELAKAILAAKSL
jgi:hypothetical protein